MLVIVIVSKTPRWWWGCWANVRGQRSVAPLAVHLQPRCKIGEEEGGCIPGNDDQKTKKGSKKIVLYSHTSWLFYTHFLFVLYCIDHAVSDQTQQQQLLLRFLLPPPGGRRQFVSKQIFGLLKKQG